MLLVAGGGAFVLTRYTAPADDAALAFAPADSLFYANAFVRPSNSQKRALDALLRRFPGFEDVDDVVEKLVELLDRRLENDGLTFDDDVDPWLGDQAAFFAAPAEGSEEPDAAALVESRDDEALRDLLERTARRETGEPLETEEREHRGVTYEVEDDGAFVFHDGFFVIGNEGGVRAAIDASGGDSLADSERFQTAIGALTDDWIGQLYVDVPGIFEAFGEELEEMTAEERASFDALGLDEGRPAAAALSVTSDSIVLEGVGGLPDDDAGAALIRGLVGGGSVPGLPGDAWFAAGLPDVGGLLGGYLDLAGRVPGFDRHEVDAQLRRETGLGLDEAFGWMGDLGFFVEGTNLQSAGLGVVVDSDDPAATGKVVDLLEELAAAQGLEPLPVSQDGLEGFTVTTAPGLPAPVSVLGGDRLVIAFGEDSAAAVSAGEDTLADSDAFRAAQDDLGDGFDVGVFVNVDAAQTFVEGALPFLGASGEVYEQDVEPYVEPFAHVVTGSKVDGDTIVTKIVIGVR